MKIQFSSSDLCIVQESRLQSTVAWLGTDVVSVTWYLLMVQTAKDVQVKE